MADTWLMVRSLFSTSVIGVGDVALHALAVAPGVVVGEETQGADLPLVVLGHEPTVAERDLEAAVGTEDLFLDLDVAIQRNREVAVDGLGFRR